MQRMTIRAGLPMPYYMDRHDVHDATPEDLARAHVSDLAVQERHGVRYLTYWFDYAAGMAFCLVESPTEAAAAAVHREAHGNLPSRIVEVGLDEVREFLGSTREPAPGEPWQESAFRTILFSQVADADGLAFRVGDARALAIVREHERIARAAIAAAAGTEVSRRADGVLAAFQSAVTAVGCAAAIQRASGTIPIRVGISAGEPVTDHGELFGAAVDLAVGVCSAAAAGEVLVTSVVHEICAGKGIDFVERGLVVVGGDRSTHVHAVRQEQWAEAPPVAATLRPDGLSVRELEVLRLLAKGRSNQQIADELVISLNTVATHVSSIFGKTGSANRTEAAAYAHRHGLA